MPRLSHSAHLSVANLNCPLGVDVGSAYFDHKRQNVTLFLIDNEWDEVALPVVVGAD